VPEVREQLANPKGQMVLLADGRAFRGAVTAVPEEAAPRELALDYVEDNPLPSVRAPQERESCLLRLAALAAI